MWIDADGRVFKAHADIRAGFANVSLPAVISDEALAALGLQPVQPVSAPVVDHTQNVSEGAPTFDGGWTQTWVVTPATPEEIAQRTQAQSAQVRTDRNARLSACDWTQLPDAGVNSAAWAVYRQALRDLPQQAGFPWTVTWPSQP